jgi:beta-glucanase (GH16 family)
MRDERRLVWSEEFGGPAGAVPDPHTWTPELGAGGWGGGQLQWYTASPSNAAIDADGRLAIVARRELGYPRGRGDAGSAPAESVTSARLTTKDRLTLHLGRVEARIKVPRGLGMWPAFWMLGSDIDGVGWPACGEIDIMECVGSQPTAVHGTLHGPGFAGLKDGLGHAHNAGVDLSEDFHVYGVEWVDDRITWLLDGAAYHSLTPQATPRHCWPFTHDVFLLINLAVGGDWPGNSTDDPPLPATMLIEWIRAYDSAVKRRR